MSRRILVRVNPEGEVTVEAEGFNGSGCEAATKAIEEALGNVRERKRKPEFRRQIPGLRNTQTLGGSEP